MDLLMAMAIGAGPAPIDSAVVMLSDDAVVVSEGASAAPVHATERKEVVYTAVTEYRPATGTLVDITHLYLPYDNKRSVEAYRSYDNVQGVECLYLPYD